MNTIRITTSQNIELEYDLAGLGERIAGYIIDMLIVAAYYIVVVIFFISTKIADGSGQWVIFLFLIPVFFYDLASEIMLNGQSVGKRVMKIKVISIDGSQPTIGQYIIRWLFRLVDFSMSFGLCAIVSVAISERKQRIGDMIAGTTLIKTHPRTNFQQTLYVPTPDVQYTVSFPDVISLSDKDIQLIKEVSLQVKTTGNHVLASQAADKIKTLLHIQTNLEPAHFLQIVIADYNHLTSKL